MNHRLQATLASTVLGSLFLAACSSTPLNTPTAAPVADAAPVAAAPASPAAPAAVPTQQIAPYLDPQNPLSQQRSVYFAFDKALVEPSYDAMLGMHGKFLASHPEVSIKLEGHTDEQGGAEYNLALGQKRADAVAHALKLLGVKDRQMEAISYGKEKPKALGHDEAAFKQNRRADLVYPAQ